MRRISNPCGSGRAAAFTGGVKPWKRKGILCLLPVWFGTRQEDEKSASQTWTVSVLVWAQCPASFCSPCEEPAFP